jgi:hypothetical protein
MPGTAGWKELARGSGLKARQCSSNCKATSWQPVSKDPTNARALLGLVTTALCCHNSHVGGRPRDLQVKFFESATEQSSATQVSIIQQYESQIEPLNSYLRINIKDLNTMGKLSFCIGIHIYIPISRPCRISPTRRDDKKKLNSLNDTINNSSTDTFECWITSSISRVCWGRWFPGPWRCRGRPRASCSSRWTRGWGWSAWSGCWTCRPACWRCRPGVNY